MGYDENHVTIYPFFKKQQKLNKTRRGQNVFKYAIASAFYSTQQSCKRASFRSLNPARYLLLKTDLGPKAK